MSVMRTLKSFPTVLTVGFREAMAYRAEMLVWVFATTMPLIMMALWTAVAKDAPVGRFQEKDFIAYFLATFVVRQLCGSWASYQMNFEVRQGMLGMKLLRPIPIVFTYAVEHLAYIPLRLVVAGPVAGVLIFFYGKEFLPKTFVAWVCVALAVMGAFGVTFLANIFIGTLSFYMQSSLKLMEVWWTLFFVFSGYLFPLTLLPPWAQTWLTWLPFRYQLGLPVELLNSMHSLPEALKLLAIQWGWVGALSLVCVVFWRGGLRRFEAFGG